MGIHWIKPAQPVQGLAECWSVCVVTVIAAGLRWNGPEGVSRLKVQQVGSAGIYPCLWPLPPRVSTSQETRVTYR